MFQLVDASFQVCPTLMTAVVVFRQLG